MSSTLSPLLDQLEGALREALDEDEGRGTAEGSYLKKVYDATSGGAALELASTQASDVFLVASLSGYFRT